MENVCSALRQSNNVVTYMNAPYTLVRATPVPPQETTQGTVLGKILFTL